MTPMEIPALDGVEAWKGGAILPPGWHDVRVVDVAEVMSSNGNPQAEIKMENPEGSITDWVTVNANTLGRVKQVLETFGVQIPAGKFAMEWSTLAGKSARIFVAEEQKNDGSGQMRSTVKAYEPSTIADSGAATPVGAGAGGSKEDDLPF
jgi:hypothetical protein